MSVLKVFCIFSGSPGSLGIFSLAVDVKNEKFLFCVLSGLYIILVLWLGTGRLYM